MKELYIKPESKFAEFKSQDVITTSGEATTEPGDDNIVDGKDLFE
jgi:hypothetical protein